MTNNPTQPNLASRATDINTMLLSSELYRNKHSSTVSSLLISVWLVGKRAPAIQELPQEKEKLLRELRLICLTEDLVQKVSEINAACGVTSIAPALPPPAWITLPHKERVALLAGEGEAPGRENKQIRSTSGQIRDGYEISWRK